MKQLPALVAWAVAATLRHGGARFAKGWLDGRRRHVRVRTIRIQATIVVPLGRAWTH